jgi:hypothetical protein
VTLKVFAAAPAGSGLIVTEIVCSVWPGMKVSVVAAIGS